MPVVTRKQIYNFTTGAADKIMQANFELNGGNTPVTNFCLQVFFSDLAVGSAATVFLMLSNDASNFTRVTGKEFAVAGSGTSSFFIFSDPAMATAQFLQLGITGVTAPGKITKVCVGY